MRLVSTTFPLVRHVHNLSKLDFIRAKISVPVRFYRFTLTMSSTDQQWSDPIEPFQPKKALILAKFSRYEFEKRRNPGMTEEELIRNVS